MGKKYKNDNQILLPKMLEIYKPTDFDWMHTSITKGSIWSIHHIHEKHYGGETTLDNLALLLKKSHELLNKLESKDYGLYFAWNDLFRDINFSKCSPSDEYVKEMIVLRKKTIKCIYGKYLND